MKIFKKIIVNLRNICSKKKEHPVDKLFNSIFRYFCALLWIGVLCCFSFSDYLLFIISDNEDSFENLFVKQNSETSMIFTNVGLIAMLCVDNIITRLITKVKQKTSVLDPCLIISIVVSIFITVISQQVVEGKFNPASWFKISYLFIIYIVCLIIYKAESLELSHNSVDFSSSN